MISLASAQATYARVLLDRVTLRRLTASGPNQTRFDVKDVPARVVSYQAQEIAGDIQQGDQRIVILAAALEAAGWTTAPRVGDVCLIGDRKTTVMSVDPNTAKLGTTTIAYWLQVRGA